MRYNKAQVNNDNDGDVDNDDRGDVDDNYDDYDNDGDDTYAFVASMCHLAVCAVRHGNVQVNNKVV